MSDALFDPLTTLGDMLLETDIETLKNLCKVAPPLHRLYVHQIYPIVSLRNETQCLDAFLSFAKLELGYPSKFRKLRLSISHGDTTQLQAALSLFLNSEALEIVEVTGTLGTIDYPDELLRVVGQIASTAARPLAMLYEGIRFVPYEFISYARHVELRMVNLDPFGMHPPASQEWPLETLSFSRDAGKPTFDNMFIRGIKLPNLTHMLLNVKSSDSDPHIIDESLLAVLENSKDFKELVLVYERALQFTSLVVILLTLFTSADSRLDFSYVAQNLQDLAQSLSSLSARRPHSILLHMIFRCSAYHAFNILTCLKSLKNFSEISILIRCRENCARLLLKHGYYLLTATGENTSFRIDRIAIRKSQQSATVYGTTVQDDATLTSASRDPTHFKMCSRVYNEEFEGFAADWVDTMIPVGDL
ncbi:hypothetical protein CVT26_003869 [Gymnopilus dilepis]|uniref:F-box domain-containing protein n=1 Tax=Gymnopilus dilepis TaxID=231916 RepID=A0A409WKE3_9AGAR|nr:hypothetical protein CVT26_003869 [Gymnopilus dilepis]